MAIEKKINKVNLKTYFLKKKKPKKKKTTKPGKHSGNISGLKTDKKGGKKEELKPCKVFFFFS